MNIKERRRFPRYDSSFEVKYATKGKASLESYTVSKNISRVGICIPVTRIVKNGDLINLDIDPNDKKGPVPAVGKVVWTKEVDRPALLEVDAGVEFVKIDPAEVERLLETVY